jgi:hypothetical protein
LKTVKNKQMNTLLALTIEIPDWLFCGPFWGGFFSCAALVFVFLRYAAANFNPWGR